MAIMLMIFPFADVKLRTSPPRINIAIVLLLTVSSGIFIIPTGTCISLGTGLNILFDKTYIPIKIRKKVNGLKYFLRLPSIYSRATVPGLIINANNK